MVLTVDLNNTFGAVLVGVLISSLLFGVTCVQAWRYFQVYQDRQYIRVMVASVMLVTSNSERTSKLTANSIHRRLMEAVHLALVMHAIYYYLVSNFGNLLALINSSWSIIWLVGITAGITLVAHLFYTHYVWQISKKNPFLTGYLLLLAMAHFGLAVSIAVEAHRLRSFTRFAKEAHSLVTASLSVAALADLSTAVAVSYLLHSSRSGWKSTDTLINRLIVYAIHNGLLTSIMDIIVLIFVTVQQHNLIFVAIFTVLGNLYAISMLATLNARRSTSRLLGQQPSEGGPTSISFTIGEASADFSGHAPQFIPMPTRVHVHSETEKAYA
ncbi:hypothetical protein HGRIS_007367 [Hohenbuehelia grisea]|uniref:DUF6534 domain-containing protein n=1 Tax=Hohenbuehelia grisea TaxID=104357 RepID=A0ABR3J517_9AGAR